MKLTVICREEGFESSILIYVVDVENPANEAEVAHAVQIERKNDLGEAANLMEILFAFDGDLKPLQDWRE